MSKEEYGVHIAHCCYIHGCKYGDPDCPVANGEVAQRYLCYACTEMENEPYTMEEIESLRKTKSHRPTYQELQKKLAGLKAENQQLQQQLKDNTKEVCEKIREFILNRRTEIKYNFTDYAKGRDSAFFEIKEFLDQIEKGE